MQLLIPDGNAQEAAKWAEIWQDEAYRNLGGHPGEDNVNRFWSVIKPSEGQSLIDLGCGSGAAGLEFYRRGLNVSWLDITDEALLPEVPRERFLKTPLWRMQFDTFWRYGFCCGVIEHLPVELAMLSVREVVDRCNIVWFDIGYNGREIKKQFGWWAVMLSSICNVSEARDCCSFGVFVVE